MPTVHLTTVRAACKPDTMILSGLVPGRSPSRTQAFGPLRKQTKCDSASKHKRACSTPSRRASEPLLEHVYSECAANINTSFWHTVGPSRCSAAWLELFPRLRSPEPTAEPPHYACLLSTRD